MSQVGMDLVDQAIGWQVRLAEASEREWRDFLAWLEVSPAHAAAFDDVATDDLLVEIAAGSAPAAVAVVPPAAPRRLRRFALWAAGGGALAAAAVAAFVIPARAPEATRYVIATAPGERRVVTLADGTRIDLNGGTRIALDRANPRLALLEAGQAMFHVRHDGAAPFEVRAGKTALRDLGTVFEVTRDAQRLDVRVAEGAVLFRPDREAIMLRPGMSLQREHDEAPVALGRVAAANVGTWRGGRLTFSETPIGEVARAIERTSGIRLDVAPGLAGRRFTGSFRLSGDAERDVPHVAALAGAHYMRQEPRWIITM